MRRALFTVTALFFCALLLLTLAASSPPAAAQGAPTPTVNSIFQPTPSGSRGGFGPSLLPTPAASGALAQTQSANPDLARQIDTINSLLSLIQTIMIVLLIVGGLALLFGIILYVESRQNVYETRDLIDQVAEETKQMRVVQEAVKLRHTDMEALSRRVDDTLNTMQDTIRDQLQVVFQNGDKQIAELQGVVNARLAELATVRREVETTLNTMQNTIRDQLQAVYDRGDRQMRALTDALAAQVRDITMLRQQVETTGNELRNQVRDQLQIVYDRGDRYVRDLLEANTLYKREVDGTRQEMLSLSQAMRDDVRDGVLKVYERGESEIKVLRELLDQRVRELEQMRKDVEAVSSQLQLQVEDEIRAANLALGDLEVVHSHIQDGLKSAQSEVSDRVGKLTHALALAQTTAQERATQALTLAYTAQNQIGRGDLSGAARSLSDALELDGGNRFIRYLLADVYIRQGRVEAGMEQLREAGAGKNEFAAADVLYAYALRQQADAETDMEVRERLYTQAADLLLKAAETHPDLLDGSGESVYGALGGLYRQQGRYQEAIAQYAKAAKVTPNSSYPINNLALTYYAAGSIPQAQELFKRSMALATRKLNANRADHFAWYDFVTAEIALEDPIDEIASHLATAISLTPDSGSLAKFVQGLRLLQGSANPPANISQIIAGVEQELQRQTVMLNGNGVRAG